MGASTTHRRCFSPPRGPSRRRLLPGSRRPRRSGRCASVACAGIPSREPPTGRRTNAPRAGTSSPSRMSPRAPARGARPNLYRDRYAEAYMRLLPTESLRKPSAFCRGLSELSTAQFWLGALYDPAIFRTIPPERMAANDEGETAAHLPAAKEKRVRSLFVALGQVTRPRAKAYGFSYPAWEKMVREASGVSPDKLKEEGRRVARRLEGA